MNDQEKLKLATTFSFEIDPVYSGEAVAVEQRDNGICLGGSGKKRWAVCHRGLCLSNKTGEWDYEPMPSSRDDEWLEEYRFTNLDVALEAAKKARDDIRTERGLVALP